MMKHKIAHFLCLLIWISACSHTPPKNEGTKEKSQEASFRSKASEALAFCKKRGYNTQMCVLIDMSIHSGKKRLVVWDFTHDSLMHRFMVSHGCCNMPWSLDWSKDNPSFSNKDGSHCSSLGKYKIGERGYSNWGINVKYALHGLEASNSNAYQRVIVLHSWEEVPQEEVYPKGTPEGWGCPTLSNADLRVLDPLLKASKKPVLLWIYR